MSEPLRPQACPQCGGLYGQHTMNCGQAWSTVKEVEGVSKLRPEDVVAVIADGIDQAVKAACAQKDQEIARLKEEATNDDVEFAKELEAKDQRIAELEADLALLKKNEVLNDNEFTDQLKRIVQMAALLEKMPHSKETNQWASPSNFLRCLPACPACEWARLKQTQ